MEKVIISFNRHKSGLIAEMNNEMDFLQKHLKNMIDMAYASTSSVLVVADQLTFLWSVYLFADDSPRKINYPFKRRLHYTWAELLGAKDDALELINIKVLKSMSITRSYVPKWMGKGGEKLMLTSTQCAVILETLTTIYSLMEEQLPPRRDLRYDSLLYDKMLDMLFGRSIEGEAEWLHYDSVDFMATLAAHHAMKMDSSPDGVHVLDVYCRSGQLLTGSYRENTRVVPRTSRFVGYNNSPIWRRITLMRLLLSQVRKFNVRTYPQFTTVRVLGKKLIKDKEQNLFDIVYVYPPKVDKELDPELLRLTGYGKAELAYLRFGLIQTSPGGILLAVLPEYMLGDEGVMELIHPEARLLSVIRLPEEPARMYASDKSMLIIIENTSMPRKQSWGEVRSYELEGFGRQYTNAFIQQYDVSRPTNAVTDLKSVIEVKRTEVPNKGPSDHLLASIRKLEEMLLPLDEKQKAKEIQNWMTEIRQFDYDAGEALQYLLRERRIEAVVSGFGIYYKPSRSRLERLHANWMGADSYLSELLSGVQLRLYTEICKSEAPIAIHKARQKLAQEDQNIFTIQQAVDTVFMLGRMGFLECIYETVDSSGLEPDARVISLWTKVPEGNR